MPIWITELARWLGLTSDSKRPNVGAILIAIAAGLLAMGYKPSDVATWSEQLVGMVEALGAFVLKPDNAIASVLAGAGVLMMRGRNGTDLTPEEVVALRAELAVLRARREAKPPALEVDP